MAKRQTKNIETNGKELLNKTDEGYRTKKCRVLYYNKNTKELDIEFEGYGVRLNHAELINSDFVSVKYNGEIGKPGFYCRL